MRSENIPIDSHLFASEKLSEERLRERNSARAERDSAREERDDAREERDDFMDQTTNLENNHAAQELFLATISHDLNNPISAIKMATEVIRAWLPQGEVKDMISLIERNANQAGELIRLLLDAHLIKSGAKLPIHARRCNVIEILEKCLDSLAPSIKEKFSLVGSPQIEVWGIWDAVALERAFKNLISNAIKFSFADQNIQIQVRQDAEATSISIQNFGEVISLENQLKIFDSQYRVQNVEPQKGWGLGLTLVRGITEAHNGKVEVTSNQQDGTTFTIRIPNA